MSFIVSPDLGRICFYPLVDDRLYRVIVSSLEQEGKTISSHFNVYTVILGLKLGMVKIWYSHEVCH